MKRGRSDKNVADLEKVCQGQIDIWHARLYYPKGVRVSRSIFYITPLALEMWLKVENLGQY